MYELLLAGQYPAPRLDELLRVLAGFTASQPQHFLERHVIYKPIRAPVRRELQTGGTQNIQTQKRTANEPARTDLYYVQLVQTLDWTGAAAGANEPWTEQFRDVPEPGKTDAALRRASDTAVTAGDPQQYMKALGYNFLSEYVQEGYRFIHNNVIISIHRILRLPPPDQQAPRSSLPPLEELAPLDPSGTFVVEATSRLHEANNVELMKRGTAELLGFKDSMRGLVELKAPERLSLDTRVK